MNTEADWHDDAACRDHPAELFFPDELRGERQRLAESEAKAICRRCPVLIRCAQHAVEAPETYGVWGATTAKERVAFRSSVGLAKQPQQSAGGRVIRKRQGA